MCLDHFEEEDFVNLLNIRSVEIVINKNKNEKSA